MSESHTMRHLQIDFDHWSDLASSDPAAFEARRNQLIEDVIRRAPAHRQQRLRGLQWRLDLVRSRSQTPLAACIRISEMMWEAVIGEGGLRDTLECVADPAKLPSRRPRAQVVPLRNARRDLS